MRKRLPLVLSVTALAVSVLGSTPLGEAARNAMAQLPRNSVGTLQLKRNSVGTAQLKRSAVTSNKVKNRSLLAVDFALGQLPKGDKGDTGAAGPQGPAGPAGAISNAVARSVSENVTDGFYRRLSVSCNSGEKAIAGGVGTTSTASDVSLRESKPSTGGLPPASGGTFTGWTGALLNATGGAATAEFIVWVICVT